MRKCIRRGEPEGDVRGGEDDEAVRRDANEAGRRGAARLGDRTRPERDGDGQQQTGKTGERFKVACGCQPPRSFWIRAKQYSPGPITCGICGQDFQPQDVGHQ